MKRVITAFLFLSFVLAGAAFAEQQLEVDPSRYVNAPSIIGYVPDRFIVVLNDDVTVNHVKDMDRRVALSDMEGFSELAQRFQVDQLRRFDYHYRVPSERGRQ